MEIFIYTKILQKIFKHVQTQAIPTPPRSLQLRRLPFQQERDVLLEREGATF